MNRKLDRECHGALSGVFGVSGYRPGQKAAASCLLSGRDLLCILPTGAGKSLCWQLPAVVHPGLTVVISPLIALMHDQVAGLRRRGVGAAALNSLMPAHERRETERQIRAGEVRILLVAPERLENRAFLRLMQDCPPWLLVVDEAHCVVQWGESFRPAYSRIGGFVRSLARRPVLCAMTATADRRMQRQIVSSLGLIFHKRVMLPVLRENLRYSVCTTLGRTREILRLMGESPCRTVVFCRSRVRAESLAESLRRAGVAAEHYHAGLTREERLDAQERFRTGAVQLLAATTAFGMGIDIPDIRRVIHDSLPGSITDLVQQSGRAGRDGKPAECIILLSPQELLQSGEVLSSMYQATRYHPLARFRLMRREWTPLRRLLQLLLTGECITGGISAAFGQHAQPCGRCSACLRGPLAANVPELTRMDAPALRLWLMEMQLNALARRRNADPRTLISPEALQQAAREMILPELPDPAVQAALQRMVTAFRRIGPAGGSSGNDKSGRGFFHNSA